MWVIRTELAFIEFLRRTEDATDLGIGLEQREKYRDALDDRGFDLGAKKLPVLPVSILDTLETPVHLRIGNSANVNSELGADGSCQQLFQLLCPGCDVQFRICIVLKAKLGQQFSVVLINLLADAAPFGPGTPPSRSLRDKTTRNLLTKGQVVSNDDYTYQQNGAAS
ncbi:MAG: hypothetical protein ACYDC6_13000 [Acidobacteriaceae bacterium]